MGVEKSLSESDGQGAVTTPHIPTNLIAAVGDMQRKLRPFLDGSKKERELPPGQVGAVCDQLKHALAMQSERGTDELYEFGTVVRREAYRFPMRSKLIQLAQAKG